MVQAIDYTLLVHGEVTYRVLNSILKYFIFYMLLHHNTSMFSD